MGDRLPAAVYFHPNISPDGKRLAIAISATGKRDIWIIDIERKTPIRLTFNGDSDNPAWSPDGSVIYYSSNRNGFNHIFARHADGSGSEEPVLAVEGSAQTVKDISRDGRYLLYEISNGGILRPITGRTEVWAMPLFGDRKPFPLLDDFASHDPTFSPDGKFVAYENNATGAYEAYITPFPAGGAKWQVTTGGSGGPPRWRGDEKVLYFMTPKGISSVNVIEKGAAVSLSTPQLLFDAHLVSSGTGPFALASQDGSRFFLNATDAVTATQRVDAIVLTNWPAELKK